MSKKQMIRQRGLSAFLAMAMCFGLLPATAWAAEEGVAIDESNFPNKTFRNYIQKVFDKDNNDFFSADEIAAVTAIIISKSCPAIIIGLPVWISAGIIS